MPTPPPWWKLTQLAPAAVLSRALRMRPVGDRVGAVAHALGLAVRARPPSPQSRWSRPITMGALTSPRATSSLKTAPILARSPYSSQQMRAGQALEVHLARRHAHPAGHHLVVGEGLEHGAVGARRCRPGRPRAPPSGTARCRGRTAAGCRAARSPGRRRRRRSRPPGPRRGCCCRSRTRARRPSAGRPWPRRASTMLATARRAYSPGSLRAQRERLALGSCRWARSRSACRAPRSGR